MNKDLLVYLPTGVEEGAEFRFNPESHRYALRPGGQVGWKPCPGVTTISGLIWPSAKQEGIKGWVARETTEHLARSLSFQNGVLVWQEGMHLPPDQRPDPVPFEQVVRENPKAVWTDAKKGHKLTLADAADVGTQVHAWADSYWKAPDTAMAEYAVLRDAWDKSAALATALGESAPDRRVLTGIEALQRWIGEHHLKVVASEVFVYNTELWYAGQADLIAYVDGVLMMVDLKTSNFISEGHLVQCGGYIMGLEFPVEGAGILRLGKEDGLPEWVDFTPVMADSIEAFKNSLAIYNHLKSLKGVLS